MYETLIEVATELGPAVVRAVGAVCAAGAGIFVEMNGIQTLGTGEQVIGVWMALLGLLLLGVGYVLAGETVDSFRQSAN